MAPSKWEVGIILVTQMGVGLLGNSFLLCLYNFTLLTGHKVRPTDLILNQLVLANSLVLFSRGIPHTMAAFGSKHFLNEAGCNFLFYLQRVARGICFSTASILSGFQAIRLCPNFSRWMEHRMRSPKCVAFLCFLCWILHLLVNIVILFQMTSTTHSENFSTNMKVNYGYCSSVNPDRITSFVVTAIFFTTDFISSALMVWASGSMVIFLHRHKQRVQHIHSNSHSSRRSAEARATCTILILVSSFFSFYSLSSLLSIWMTLFVIPGQWLIDLSIFLSLCFPTFSPFVLICSDTRVTCKTVVLSSRQGKHLLIWL
ncbi:vomeronasal type-1 receptor 1-like [Hippopotamus amphibius kiboko]|uniref:vomeronasal type-1 receptor 1-like n=1 Tax=Hippopotamus amphibius kiboko TaxID=575201 RepID=UPI00259A33ED|nr:vomeronasal type-1 receptor 1-like [Hippopotamus amphibius kiboko]